MKKVSIISGLYNCEAYLSRCLTSIYNQSYENIEVILVCNASVDKTFNIASEFFEKYKNNTVLFNTDQKLGPGGSREKGLELATGDYLAFIDCDDYIDDQYITELVSTAERNNFPDIVFSSFNKVRLDGSLIYARCFNDEKEALVQSIAPWAKLFRKDFLIRNSLSFHNMVFGEDIFFSSEIYLKNPSLAIANKNAVYNWLDNPNSTSHTELRNFPDKVLETSSEQFERMLNNINNQNDIYSYFITKYYLWYLLQSGRGVSMKNMTNEYNKIFGYVKKISPNWYRNRYVLREDKTMIKMAIIIARILYRIKLLKIALAVYSKLPMEKLWPSL